MSLILVTGISTSGKSTIAKELSVRGFEAYDTEHNGISAWYNKQTGERAAEFGENAGTNKKMARPAPVANLERLGGKNGNSVQK